MGVTFLVTPTFFAWRVPPCGASYFAPGGKVGKTPPGIASGEHLPTVVLTVSLSPDPFYGSGPLRSGSYFRRAKSRPVPVLLSAHWGLLPSKFTSGCFYCAPPPASLPVWCSSGRTDQLPRFCQSRRYPYNADILNFHLVGACVPGARRKFRPGFARRMKVPISWEGIPRNGGLGDDAYEHRRKPGVHRRRPPAILSCLSDRSERHNASPPRRAEPQRRNEVSHKVLCQAFFQESALIP